jgi:polar amino acid transport system permease protein
VNTADQTHPAAVKRLLVLVALTAGVSLLIGVQYYLGGPLRLSVVSEIHDLALSPNGLLVAAGARDGTVRLWELPRNEETRKHEDWAKRELSGHEDSVVSVAFDRRGSTLFSASRDGTVRLWDVETGEVKTVLDVPDAQAVVDMSLSADDATLACIDQNGFVHIWDVASAQLLQSIAPTAETGQAVALSADGALVAAGDGATIQIWSTRTGEPVQRLEGYWEDEETQEDWLGHDGAVTALAFSPDGTLLGSGGVDKTIVFWDLEGSEVLGIGEGHFAAITKLVFDQQGRTVLSGSSDNKVKSWRVPGGKVSGTFVGHLGIVNGMAFGPDDQSILSAGDDGTLRLWDVINTSETHIEWTSRGLQSIWGRLFSIWMPLSGLVGLVCLWGLWRVRGWGHLLGLTLYIVGPIIVLGLPLIEAYFYPFSVGTRLQIAWPLAVLAVWYGLLVVTFMREPVTVFYAAPRDATLAEKLMASQRTRRLRVGLFIGAVWVLLLVLVYSILRQFNLDLAFMGHFFDFIMEGSWLTFRISAYSIFLAVVLALLGALGRLSRNPIANGVSGFYISIIRGTPLLVQIYIWYLGLPRLDIVLPAFWAGFLALGVNYGAYMTEIFRAGIQAIGIGQHEAAEALGMSRVQTLRRIVLPQAFRIVIPPIGNEFIAMMKDSSLVSIMAVWELSFRAQKIGRQYFRSLETFMIAAAFYWILTVIFQFLQGKLEGYMARGDRPLIAH